MESGNSKAAAFFDVDGTIVGTTIVHYYVYFRRRRMSRFLGSLWYAVYLIKCGYYLVLDKLDRKMLNVVFYRTYAGLPTGEIKAMAPDCYRDVIQPRRFPDAARCMARHQQEGHEVVLVTGSLDFIVAPLAQSLGVQGVVASCLRERNGRFTGELDGPPLGEVEKVRRIRLFAEAHGIDLSRSHAYGDSIADLPMLALVGFPHAVNPDRALAAAARSRGWPIHCWTASPDSIGDHP